jgi:hypothetical protein
LLEQVAGLDPSFDVGTLGISGHRSIVPQAWLYCELASGSRIRNNERATGLKTGSAGRFLPSQSVVKRDGIRAAMHPRGRRCSSLKYGPIFSLVAPCPRGASRLSVLAARSTTNC